MGTIYRPAFGRPCYDGCGNIVPTQRIEELRRRAAANNDVLRPMDRLCVDCEKRHRDEATVTRRPRP